MTGKRKNTTMEKEAGEIWKGSDITHLEECIGWYHAVLSTNIPAQNTLIDNVYHPDVVFVDPFVTARGIENVKYIFNTIGRFNDYAEGYVIHGFETTQLPSSPSSKKTKKPRIQSVIKPEAVLSSEIHTIQRSAKHIIILDAINHYQFKSLWFWMCWQMIAGRTFTYRSTHKFYLNGAGKVILHEELYSMREFLLEFAIIGFFYKLWIVFNTWLWVPTGLWEWVLQNCA